MANVTIPDLTPGVQYSIQINAQDDAELSPWSPALTVTAGPDTVPPLQPAAPVGVGDTGFAKIQVNCSLLDHLGGTLAPDTSYFEVYIDTTSVIVPVKTGGTANYYGNITCASTFSVTIPCSGTFIIPASRANDTDTSTSVSYWVAVIAVDTSGNKSPLSATSVVTVGLIDNLYVGYASLTDANIQNLSVTKLIAGSGVITDLTVYSTLTLGSSSTLGTIKSADWVSGVSGFKLWDGGLEINTGTIIGATFQSTGWVSGISGFKLWNGGLEINEGSIVGAVYQTISGLSSLSSIVGIKINGSTDRINFYPGTSVITPGFIQTKSTGSGGTLTAYMVIESPQLQTGSGTIASMQLFALNAVGGSEIDLNAEVIQFNALSGVNCNSGMFVGGPLSTSGAINAVNNIGVDNSTASGFPTANYYVQNLGNLTLAGGSAVPAMWSTTGQLYKGTSSEKYKTDIIDHELDDRILQLQPRQFKYKIDIENMGDKATEVVGLIAEEVHELGLSGLVFYDIDGNIESVHYDRLPVYMLPIIQRHEKEIKELKERLGNDTTTINA